jgi:hypothetical protein
MKNSAVTMVRARAFVEGWSVTAGVSDMEDIPFSRRTGVSFTISQAPKTEFIPSLHFPTFSPFHNVA